MKKITLKKMTNYIKTSIKCLEIVSLLIESEIITDQEKGNKKMELEIFKYENKEVRTKVIDDEPYFNLKDVCEILELENTSRAKSRLNNPGVITSKVGVVTGKKADGTPAIQQVEMTFINESNLYKLIFQSRKPEAEKFTDWVTSEVLPSIRKHGAYMTDSTLEQALTSPDFLIKLATNLKLEKEKNKQLEQKIEQDKPRVSFAETIEKASDCILVREFSKILGNDGMHIGEKKLYQQLRKWGYILLNSTEPTQRAIQQGLFKINERVIKTVKGDMLTKTTLITGKGQLFLLEKFKKHC